MLRIQLTFIKCAFLCISQGNAQSLDFEQQITRSTDPLAKHYLRVNAASMYPVALGVTPAFGRGTRETKLKEERGNNVSEIKANSQLEALGFGIGYDLGAGLGAGVNYTRTFLRSEVETDEIDADPLEETLAGQFTSLWSAIELTEQIKAGFKLRFIETQHNIVGNFFINPNNKTTFKSSLFSTGAGIHGNFNRLAVGLYFQQAAKGKAVILGEERIVTQPGLVDIHAAITGNKVNSGIMYRRYLFKDEELSEGTTINDEDQSEISLLGMDPEWNTLFMTSQIGIGAEVTAQEKTQIYLGLNRIESEFNFDLQNSLPGNNENNEKFTYLKLTGAIILNNPQFNLFGGMSLSSGKNHSFSLSNNTKYTFQSSERLIFIVLTASI